MLTQDRGWDPLPFIFFLLFWVKSVKTTERNTIFSRDLSKKTEEELKSYDKDHISCHKTDRMDWWSVANLKPRASSKSTWAIFYDKEASPLPIVSSPHIRYTI